METDVENHQPLKEIEDHEREDQLDITTGMSGFGWNTGAN